MSLMNEKDRLKFIEALHRLYPNPKCELDWSNPWELMMAIILSAQSTDKNVNKNKEIVNKTARFLTFYKSFFIIFIESEVQTIGRSL